MKNYIKNRMEDGSFPTGHSRVSYLNEFSIANYNGNFFAHYVFPSDLRRSATISLKINGSKTNSKLCSLRTVEVKKMRNPSWFKKGHIPYIKIKFTKKEVEEVIRLYNQGFSIKKIADKCKCSCMPIKRILSENKIKRRTTSEAVKLCFKNNENLPLHKIKFSREKISLIIKFYKSGFSKIEISKKLKCSVTPITRVLLENKIKLRNMSEVNKLKFKKYPAWNKGKKLPELSKKMKGKNNPMYGKASWNKGLKGVMVAWNKGLTIEDPRIKKIIEKQIGRPVSKEKRKKISQSVKKLMTKEYKKKISEWTKNGMTKEIRKKLSQKKKEWIKNNPELARKYMEHWINSGTYGFGTYATASDGHLCYSSLELWVDEKLTKYGLKHKIHPSVPNSTKFADFLVNGIYIEVDGMGKETEEDWNGKLDIYRKNNLKFLIIKPKDDIDKILEDIKNGKFN